MADTLSIEEMNRARAALGMPLLPVPSSNSSTSNLEFKKSSSSKGAEDEGESSEEEDPGSTLESRQAAASDNWKKLQAEADEKKRREERRAALKKERDAAQRHARLEGKGLGAAKDGEDALDTTAWLLGAGKRQKKIAKERTRMLQKELEDREKLAQTQYTETDLAGKKVGHELGDFDEGEQILTLKDAAVDDDDEDDELENLNLRENEKLKERLKLKSRKAVYDPNDDGETGEKSILGQYDEEIDGKKGKRFTLDGQGRTEEEAKGLSSAQESAGTQRVKFNLDFLEETKPASDYLDVSEVKIKKPKKKKDRAKRQRPADDEDDIFVGAENGASATRAINVMEVEAPQPDGVPAKRRYVDSAFGDDDDLQSHLATQRRLALKKRKLGRPEDIARQLRAEAPTTPDPDAMITDGKNEGQDAEEGGLVIDETSEFVANLQKPEAQQRRREASSRPRSMSNRNSAAPTPGHESDGDVEMEQRNGEDSEPDADEEMDGREESGARSERETSTPMPGDSHTATGLANEETLNNSGIGATLGMLTQRGLVKANQGDELNQSHSRQADFLRHKERLEKEWERKAQEKRRRDRENGVFERLSKRQQEEYAQQENKQRDQYVSRQLDELFNREYKPHVELRYVDEHGRRMDQREAFKQMSHQFHGKGSGKLKTEKRLKKIDDEKKREAMSSLDSSRTGMDTAMGSMGKRKGQAGVRLQ